jgi:hypothetical protein
MSHTIQPRESDGLRFINPKGLYDPAPNEKELSANQEEMRIGRRNHQ